jgi:hypothetical protein
MFNMKKRRCSNDEVSTKPNVQSSYVKLKEQMLLSQDQLTQVRKELQQTLVNHANVAADLLLVQDQLAQVRLELQQTLRNQANDKADFLLVRMELVKTQRHKENVQVSVEDVRLHFVEK